MLIIIQLLKAKSNNKIPIKNLPFIKKLLQFTIDFGSNYRILYFRYLKKAYRHKIECLYASCKIFISDRIN